jgi:ABC-type lipoprotein export system ATPase subunit
MKKSKVIFCDEPSAALDKNNTMLILSLLRKMADLGTIVVIATHDPIVVNSCDRRIEL